MAVVNLHVPDVSCEGCANAISTAVGSLWGVCGVTVNVPGKVVTVNYNEDEVKPAEIKARIEEAGYEIQPPDEYRASQRPIR
jgi:copper chaperone